MDEHLLLTEPRLFGRVERRLAQMERPPFEFCVVDEAQDIGVAELRFLAALGAGRPDALFFPVTSVKGTSRRRSPGEPWGSTSAGARTPCGSTTAAPIRSGGRRTAAAARDLGRGRQHRPANRHRLRVQRGKPAIRILPSPDDETTGRRRSEPPMSPLSVSMHRDTISCLSATHEHRSEDPTTPALDRLPEEETRAAERYCEHLTQQRHPLTGVLANATEVDEPLNDADRAALHQGRLALDAGDTVSDDELRFGAGSGSLGAARPEWCRTAGRKGRQPQEI